MRKTLFLLPLVLAACGEAPPPEGLPAADAAYQKTLQQQLLDAKPGSVIEVPAGVHRFDRGLSLRANGVTLRGAGHDKSILSFKGQIAGPEGLLVYANDFTIEHLGIEDTKGDALKINDGENITIRSVRTEWTGGPSSDNGAYGLYPVKCRNVLIEDSIAIGARDAGIYVGQSRNVIVRRSRAEKNVAGIEIENTIGADVYENTATGNTGGILVFNMPNLSQHGEASRVFKNKVTANNLSNFGAKGTPVASVPAGSGVVINSNDKVEIFDNDIADNRTANVIVSSYFSTNYGGKSAEAGYNPYPKAIFIYANRFSGGGESPDGLDLKALKTSVYGITGHFPDVLWDGFVDEKRLVNGLPPAEERLCVQNGDSGVLNADGPHGYKNPNNDPAPYRCELPKLPAVVIAEKQG